MSRPNYLPLPLVYEGNRQREYRSIDLRCMGRLVRVTFYATLEHSFTVVRGRSFRDDQIGAAKGDLWGWGWNHAGVVGWRLRRILHERGLIDQDGHLTV